MREVGRDNRHLITTPKIFNNFFVVLLLCSSLAIQLKFDKISEMAKPINYENLNTVILLVFYILAK